MTSGNNTAIIAVTEKGINLGLHIGKQINADLYIPVKHAPLVADKCYKYDALQNCFCDLFSKYSNIIAVMAQGIVTRMIVPYVKSKYTDPAIVTCDEVGRYAISTLSGHEGGANVLAHMVSSITGAQPVITTATEANRLYIVGIGCRKGTTKKDIIEAIYHGCELAKISLADIRLLTSAWVKKDEQGLLEAAEDLKLYLRFIPESFFHNPYYKFKIYDAPMKHFGIPGVAEPSAVIAAINPVTILERTVVGKVTIAIVKEKVIGDE